MKNSCLEKTRFQPAIQPAIGPLIEIVPQFPDSPTRKVSSLIDHLRTKISPPGGEVIKKACDEWDLSLSIKGFQFTRDAFASNVKSKGRQSKLSEPSLFDLLDKLEKKQIEAEVVGREGDSFYLRFRIKLAA
jgi:hypothetical protein